MMRIRRCIQLAATILLGYSAAAQATATQEEMFKSINASVSESVDPIRFIAGAVMVVAIIVAGVLLANKLKRPIGKPATLNHSGRLLKEIVTRLRIKPAQLRQLKALASERQLESPLTLILCPSLRTRTPPMTKSA